MTGSAYRALAWAVIARALHDLSGQPYDHWRQSTANRVSRAEQADAAEFLWLRTDRDTCRWFMLAGLDLARFRQRFRVYAIAYRHGRDWTPELQWRFRLEPTVQALSERGTRTASYRNESRCGTIGWERAS